MNRSQTFYFVKNNGQLNSPCEYALIQPEYQVHFYRRKVIFYLTKEPMVTDRIVMKVLGCPNVQLIAQRPLDGEGRTYEQLRYINACDGIDLEFSIEQGMLVQNRIVKKESCIDQLQFQFEGQTHIELADENAIRIDGVHECFEFKCPCADSLHWNK